MPNIPLYRIHNWETVFENNRTREIKDLQYVSLPNRHDGSKYVELMDHASGPAHFGAWVLMVQVAARCGKTAGSRGYLRRGDGTPHTPRSLSLVTRCPEKVFAEAIKRLLDLGWLEIDSESAIPHYSAMIPQDAAAESHDGAALRGQEGTGEERNIVDLEPPNPQGGDLESVGKQSIKDFTSRVISYLNRKTGKNYKVVKGTERLIGARLKDGFHPDDFKTVIDRKCADWLNDEKMEQYLRPVTLFGASKMEGYLNQLGPGLTTPATNGHIHRDHQTPDQAQPYVPLL